MIQEDKKWLCGCQWPVIPVVICKVSAEQTVREMTIVVCGMLVATVVTFVTINYEAAYSLCTRRNVMIHH